MDGDGDLSRESASERDHGGSERDHAASERDHAASERDHAASERERGEGESEAAGAKPGLFDDDQKQIVNRPGLGPLQVWPPKKRSDFDSMEEFIAHIDEVSRWNNQMPPRGPRKPKGEQVRARVPIPAPPGNGSRPRD